MENYAVKTSPKLFLKFCGLSVLAEGALGIVAAIVITVILLFAAGKLTLLNGVL